MSIGRHTIQGDRGKSSGSSKQYDKGYRDGYMEGLSECGPLTGFTKWFSRKATTKKLGKMKEEERHDVVTQALAQYEAEGEGAKERLLGNPATNPSSAEHKKSAVRNLDNARVYLDQVKTYSNKEDKFRKALDAVVYSRIAAEESLTVRDISGIRKAQVVRDAAENIIRKLCGLSKLKNPSEAGSAALGGITGGLLLGPLGAAAGGYTGVKLKKRASSKKAARTSARRKSSKRKNPTVGRLVRDALK